MGSPLVPHRRPGLLARTGLRHLAPRLRPLVAAAVLAGVSGAGLAGITGCEPTRTMVAVERPGHPGAIIEKDLAYARTSAAQRLDLYRPTKGRGALPLIVELHGGGFVAGDKAAAADQAVIDALVAHGYAVASINYRLAGEALFPAGVLDVKAAVRWLRAHASEYRLDPDRFGAMGESAGGYMAVMLAVSASTAAFDDDRLGNPGVSSAVQAAVDWWGPIDFSTMDHQLRVDPACPANFTSPNAARSIYSGWLGAPLLTVPSKVWAADPATYLPTVRSLPPVLIEHGDEDCTVPYQQSVDLGRALRRVRGASVRVEVFHGAGHGDDFPVATQLPVAARFFDTALASGAPPAAEPTTEPTTGPTSHPG
jgi:acetyl esterase/lipase